MRTALLIATDRYRDPTFTALRSPQRDVAELARVLGDPAIGGFATEVLVNEPSGLLRERVEEVFCAAGRDDLVLLHVSGHGVKDRFGKLHFVAADTRNDLLASSAVSAAFVCDMIGQSMAAQVVVWLDCCYGGAFPSGLLPRAAGSVDVVAQLEGRGCSIMTASTHIQWAYEPGGRAADGTALPSAFTHAIVEGLGTGAADLDGDGEITTAELYSYVHDRVRAQHPGQTPTSGGTVSGHLVIARAGAALPPDLPDELRRMLLSSRPELRSDAVSILRGRARRGDATASAALLGLGLGAEPGTAGPAPTAPEPADPGMVAPRPAASAPPVGGRFERVGWLGRGAGSVSFSPDSRSVAFGERVVDTRTWRTAHRLGEVGASAFGPDGALLAVDGLATLRLLSTADFSEVHRLDGPPDRAEWLAFGHDGRALVRSGSTSTRLWVVDRTRWWTRELVAGVSDMAFGASAPRFATCTFRGEVALWDTTSWRRLGTRSLPGVERVAVSPDGRLLAAATPGRTTVWRTTDWAVTSEPPSGVAPFGALAFAPDGRTLAIVAKSGVGLWDALTGEHRRTLPSGANRVAFSPDGRLLAVVHGVDAWVWGGDDLGDLPTDPPPPRTGAQHDRTVKWWITRTLLTAAAGVGGVVGTFAVGGAGWPTALVALVVGTGAGSATRFALKRAKTS